ncbi:hypothetical protein [Nitratidesulfovibrio liaohensis]|uniref:hypothetical protein n=1 Tax=Nitratidesulfovibrio liaohensis TaxID=2604158 RepID=UPI00142356AF|nr:hypothetical protein [Nitratidesulfovibrio liaohensis]NHZ48392.1 hypothetical protein [Nitratidesulfovibrio liaohensis]
MTKQLCTLYPTPATITPRIRRPEPHEEPFDAVANNIGSTCAATRGDEVTFLEKAPRGETMNVPVPGHSETEAGSDTADTSDMADLILNVENAIAGIHGIADAIESAALAIEPMARLAAGLALVQAPGAVTSLARLALVDAHFSNAQKKYRNIAEELEGYLGHMKVDAYRNAAG